MWASFVSGSIRTSGETAFFSRAPGSNGGLDLCVYSLLFVIASALFHRRLAVPCLHARRPLPPRTATPRATRGWCPRAVGGEQGLFPSVFNSLGLLPLIFLSILVGGGAFRKGRQSLPPLPFIFASEFLGFFAMGPYLAFRNYTPVGDGEEPGLLEVRG